MGNLPQGINMIHEQIKLEKITVGKGVIILKQFQNRRYLLRIAKSLLTMGEATLRFSISVPIRQYVK